MKQEELVYDLLRKLCSIPAPSGMEDERAAFCLAELRSYGAVSAEIDDAKNVLFLLEGNTEEIIVFAAHTDTVFPDREPYPYREDDEKIYCPGCGDDTVCVAQLMACIKDLLASGKKPEYSILFALNSCEEGLGNLKGTRAIMDRFGERIKAFISFDSGYTRVLSASVGSVRYRVSVETEGGHSYGMFGNRNAIHILSQGITDIYSIQVPQNGGKTTYNVGTVRGGTSVNSIAQNAEMLCEFRSDRAEDLKIMEAEFRKVFDKMRESGAKVNVEVVGVRPGMVGVDKNKQRALIDLCIRIQEKHTGLKVEEKSASTDCNIPHSMGIPGFCAGVYYGAGAHTREEWITKESIPKGYRIARELIGYFVNGGTF